MYILFKVYVNGIRRLINSAQGVREDIPGPITLLMQGIVVCVNRFLSGFFMVIRVFLSPL